MVTLMTWSQKCSLKSIVLFLIYDIFLPEYYTIKYFNDHQIRAKIVKHALKLKSFLIYYS